MVRVDGGSRVADVHGLALASRLALALAGPRHARFFAALLRGLDLMPFQHGADVREAGLLETVDQASVGIVVDHGASPGL